MGSLGPEALRAGGLGKHGLAITRSVLERHGRSTCGGLAVLGEALRGYGYRSRKWPSELGGGSGGISGSATLIFV